MMAVFKLQRPLFSTESMQHVLIYDENITYLIQLELPQETIDQLFDADEYKVFWEGRCEDGLFQAEKKLDMSEWPSW